MHGASLTLLTVQQSIPSPDELSWVGYCRNDADLVDRAGLARHGRPWPSEMETRQSREPDLRFFSPLAASAAESLTTSANASVTGRLPSLVCRACFEGKATKSFYSYILGY